jgi:hypothetical protein
MRLLITVLAAAASLAILTPVAAAGADVRITALDCGSHPRRIRIENQGDAAQDLSGWQLQSDPAEGGPWDLGPIGSLDAGKKAFVFQGHLSPAVNPDLGYYRWGSDEIFNLRANDSTDFVRIVDAQGNTVHQRNCEGLPPGATPAPPSEFDPPPVVAAPVATVAATATPAPAATAVRTAAPIRAIGGGSGLPAGGGRPPADRGVPATLALAEGAVLLAAGMLLVTLSLKRGKPGA